jgi:predicted dithiol-disulfide oxidoreductase (DUF899 family)
LAHHDVTLCAISRAPFAKLRAYQMRMGWTFPWASSYVDAKDEAPEEGKKVAASVGLDWATYTREAPGMSAFALDEGAIYHTYSAYARGLDVLWGLYQWLDRAPKGRNETSFWLRRRDEYGKPA